MPATQLDHDSLPTLGAAGEGDADIRAALAQTHLIRGEAPIVPGLALAWSVALDHGAVSLQVQARGLVVWTTTLGDGKACETWRDNQGLFKEDVTFCVDFALGELTITGDVCVLEKGGWKCHHFPTLVLAAWSPTLGAVGGEVLAHPPQVDDGSGGSSHSIVPTITRIPVDAVARVGTPVGSMVKAALFAAVPDFVFNVCFAVGPFRVLRPGAYGDPTSPWWNVFAGYYQLDCPKPSWTRPFGYTLADGVATVCFDDILRLGKADWNYFSNWMYGVPLAAVTPYDAPDPGVVCTVLDRAIIGQSQWDTVDVDGFSTVSAYQSSAKGAAQLEDNTVLTPLWRATYGEPASQPDLDTSFLGTLMHARLYMAYREDADAFHTYFFGGTVNKAFDAAGNPQFLADQLTACAKVITDHYPTLGFPPS